MIHFEIKDSIFPSEILYARQNAQVAFGIPLKLAKECGLEFHRTCCVWNSNFGFQTLDLFFWIASGPQNLGAMKFIL